MAEPSWRQLQERAQIRGLPLSAYVDMVFRYFLHEGRNVEAAHSPVVGEDEETVYFELSIPARTKHLLAERSERQRFNLASYGGLVLADFLQRFVRDPRDLATIHYLALRLDETAMLSEADLIQALVYCERHSGVRLPPGYLAKWLHHRLRSIVPEISRAGTITDLTLELIERSMQEAERLGPGRATGA